MSMLRRILRIPESAGDQAAGDVDEEIRFHLESRAEELMATGLSRQDAEARAREEFGDLDAARRALRSTAARNERRRRASDWLQGLAHDLRHTLRAWARRPALAALSLLTLTLAIGANTAIFSVVDAVLIEPLPYHEPDRVVMVWQRIPRLGWDRGPISYPNWEEWRARSRTLADLAAFRTRIPRILGSEGDVEEVPAAFATGNLFSLLGVPPAHGRALGPADAVPDAPPVAVLSHALWQRRYGGDPAVLGRTIRVQGEPRTVVGVMPSGFDFPSRDDALWLPLPPTGPAEERDTHFLQAVGRLGPGVELEAARHEMEVLFEETRAAHPDVMADYTPMLETRRAYVSGDARPMLLLLMGAVGLLLAVACANLATLALIRATTRTRELAVRAALGAGRARLLRQLLTESGLLAAAGAAAGVAVAVGGTRLLVLLGPDSLPRREAIAVDGTALAFTLGVAVLSVALFGLLPALRGSRADLRGSLHEGGRAGTGRRAGRLQRGLVVAQLALALVLLTGAGLLVNSFVRLASEDPGFDPRDVLTARVAPPEARYPDYAQVDAFYDRLLERAGALPGVRSVGAAWAAPFAGGHASGKIVLEGESPEPGREPVIGTYPVRGDYFRTLRIPLLAGRLVGGAPEFDGGSSAATQAAGDGATGPTPSGATAEAAESGATDGPGAPDGGGGDPVVVVNEAAAERFWPGRDPIGKRFKRGGADEVADDPWITVVGLVGSARRHELGEEAPPEAYWAHDQAQWAREMTLVVRTEGDPLAVVGPLRAELRALDPEIPLAGVRALAERVSASVAEPRFRAFLVACFAVLAGVLALVGIYGAMAFAVARQRHEIGVRMALGAGRLQELRRVLGRGAVLVGAGLAIGLAGALAGSRLLSGMLFRVGSLDPATYIGVAALLASCALVACWVPARRASRVDPVVALREE